MSRLSKDIALKATITVATLATLSILLLNKNARKRMVKLGKVLWDGDSEGQALRENFSAVETCMNKWGGELPALESSLGKFEVGARSLAAAEAKVMAAGAGSLNSATVQACKGLRAKLQKDLGGMHAELWKTQDRLDTCVVGRDDEARACRKALVLRLSSMHTSSEELQRRFKAAKAVLAKAAPPSGAEIGGELRGYKVTEDGRKTTFFNHDLDDEARRLIGDIRPKRVDNDGAAAGSGESGGGGGGGASAWNTAGTWEERDMTAWGKQRLGQLLGAVTASVSTASLPGRTAQTDVHVRVTRVAALTGDCSLTRVRGKVKHLFEWSFTLEWRLETTAAGKPGGTGGLETPGAVETAGCDVESATGSLRYADVTPDQLGDSSFDFDIEVAVLSVQPASVLAAESSKVVDPAVRRAQGPGLQAAVAAAVSAFAVEFNAEN